MTNKEFRMSKKTSKEFKFPKGQSKEINNSSIPINNMHTCFSVFKTKQSESSGKDHLDPLN